MTSTIKRFLSDTTGATAIEYALIAAGIALVLIPTVNLLGGKIAATFTNLTSKL